MSVHCPHCGVRIDTVRSPTQEIIRRAAEDYGVSMHAILSRQRTASVAMARAVIAYVLRTALHMTYPHIGAVLDRDHTSVIPMVRKVERRMAASEPFRLRVRRIVGNTIKRAA